MTGKIKRLLQWRKHRERETERDTERHRETQRETRRLVGWRRHRFQPGFAHSIAFRSENIFSRSVHGMKSE